MSGYAKYSIFKQWNIFAECGAFFKRKASFKSSHTCYNADEPQKHYTKGKKTVTNATNCMIPFTRNVQNRQTQRAKAD